MSGDTLLTFILKATITLITLAWRLILASHPPPHLIPSFLILTAVCTIRDSVATLLSLLNIPTNPLITTTIIITRNTLYLHLLPLLPLPLLLLLTLTFTLHHWMLMIQLHQVWE